VFLQKVLKPGASFYAIDPCYRNGQGWLQHFIISQDRGDFVRDIDRYKSLFDKEAGNATVYYAKNKLRIPYTQCVTNYIPASL
jgi:hypothetical protein